MSGDRDRLTPSSPASDSSSLAGAAAELGSAFKQRFARLLELAAASSGLAAMSGVTMLVLAIVASVLLIVAWILVVSVIAYVVVLAGVTWIAVGLGLAALHIVAAYLMYRKALRLSRDLTMPALRSALFPREE